MGSESDLQRKGMLCDPGEHFQGRYEVEHKYRVENLAPIRDQIMQRGGVAFMLENHETDIYFDMDDKRFAENDQAVCLRSMAPSGRVLWISKGPGPDRCVAMDLHDADKAVEMLTSLGFVEVLRVDKARDLYFLGALHVTLDEVPGLGPFVEIAAMTDDEQALDGLHEQIEALALNLDLSPASREALSYRALLNG